MPTPSMPERRNTSVPTCGSAKKPSVACERRAGRCRQHSRLENTASAACSSSVTCRNGTAGSVTFIKLTSPVRSSLAITQSSPDSVSSNYALPCADCRHRQSEIFAQCRARKIPAKQAAPLQLRHREAHEVLVGAGHVRRRQHEAVAGGRHEPLFELVSDLFWAADNRMMHPPPPADPDKIAHRRIGLHADDAVTNALQA